MAGKASSAAPRDVWGEVEGGWQRTSLSLVAAARAVAELVFSFASQAASCRAASSRASAWARAGRRIPQRLPRSCTSWPGKGGSRAEGERGRPRTGTPSFTSKSTSRLTGRMSASARRRARGVSDAPALPQRRGDASSCARAFDIRPVDGHGDVHVVPEERDGSEEKNDEEHLRSPGASAQVRSGEASQTSAGRVSPRAFRHRVHKEIPRHQRACGRKAGRDLTAAYR